MARIGLYLAGGGARGAYQAGVIKALSDILQTKKLPFKLISGVSVGSLNASVLAQHADNFTEGAETLYQLWSTIRCQDIFDSSNYQLGKSVLRNLSRLLLKHRHTGYLLDTTPLHEFIHKNIDFEKIKYNIENNILESMEVIANSYEQQQAISFYQHSKPNFEDWNYPRHASQRANISKEHILASSALPLFFPTVAINGFHYGDGSMGLVAPLRGALRFNVDKILILGTRHVATYQKVDEHPRKEIGFAHILGSMLSGLFLDNLDRDIEMVNRMNDISELLSVWKKRRSPWRPVETLHLRPSMSLANIAQDQYLTLPTLLRMLLNVLGASSQSGDLLSFLLFEPAFITPLLDLGYKDTLANTAAIKAFFS